MPEERYTKRMKEFVRVFVNLPNITISLKHQGMCSNTGGRKILDDVDEIIQKIVERNRHPNGL